MSRKLPSSICNRLLVKVFKIETRAESSNDVSITRRRPTIQLLSPTIDRRATREEKQFLFKYLFLMNNLSDDHREIDEEAAAAASMATKNWRNFSKTSKLIS